MTGCGHPDAARVQGQSGAGAGLGDADRLGPLGRAAGAGGIGLNGCAQLQPAGPADATHVVVALAHLQRGPRELGKPSVVRGDRRVVSKRGLTRGARESVIALIESLDRPAAACQGEGRRASGQSAADDQCMALIPRQGLGKGAAVAPVKAKGCQSAGGDQRWPHTGICQACQNRFGYLG